MISLVKGRYGDNYLAVIKNYIGKKPKTLNEIHDKLIPLITQLKTKEAENVKLNQMLSFLDGESLLDYKISVPKTAADLLNTGKLMKHCVGSYSSSVIEGRCNILNLLKDDRIAYTIELKINLSEKYFVVSQFKGYRNSRDMEGTEIGKKYREKLYELIRNHPTFL